MSDMSEFSSRVDVIIDLTSGYLDAVHVEAAAPLDDFFSLIIHVFHSDNLNLPV